jgi:hypothetical protein
MRLTTKQMVVSLVALVIVGVAIGFSVVAAQSRQAQSREEICAPSKHRHRYSDLKAALVEVSEVDACGFRFTDLEQPVSDHVQFAGDFTVSEVSEVEGSGDLHTTRRPRSSLRAGSRGGIAYCGVCRAVFSFKTWRKEK